MSENNPTPPLEPAAVAPKSALWRNPWLWLALAVVLLVGWQWLETRSRLLQTQAEVTRRLSELDANRQQNAASAQEMQAQNTELQERLAAVEEKQAEFSGQSTALQGLYQDLARSRDEAVLFEIEQALNLAVQQLQVAGNVPAAILALQNADSKLALLDRPQFMGLRKALARDLDRLRALPLLDMTGLGLKLENLVADVDNFPLAMEERPRQEARPAAKKAATGTEASPLWQQIPALIWAEIRALVRIQRFDRAEPILLAPEQAFFLRENLKLRLLNARLALQSRDPSTFRNDLKQARLWLARHFDAAHPAVKTALSSLQQVAAAEFSLQLPNLNDSQSALRSLRHGRGQK